jgi:fumarylacetoacetate (FAA) hydrolase
MAPLPRAFQWVQGAAYVNHDVLLHQARGEEAPASLNTDPRLVQGASDDFLGPCDDVVCASEAYGIDFSAGLAVITSDVRMGATAAQALDGVRLVMLANDVRLRHLMSAEPARGAGGLQSQPTTAFSPVAVTLDELGDTWDKGRLSLLLQSTWNGRKVGLCETGPEMSFHFGQLMAHLCKTRNLRAGSIIGSGPVSNQGSQAKSRTDWPKGYSCIAEKRAMETIQDGQPATGFMKYGDTIRIEMKGRDGKSLFGAIDQEIVPLDKAQPSC